MEYTDIGSLTLVVSEKHEEIDMLTDTEAEEVVDALVRYIQFNLAEKKLQDKVKITARTWERGCITVVIFFGAAAVTGFSAVELIKNYKDIREGLSLMIHDIKNAGVWIKRKIFRKGNKKQAELAPAMLQPAPKDPVEIVIEQVLEQYRSLSLDERKYWAAGQQVTFVNNEGKYSRLTVAVKREDIALLDAPASESAMIDDKKKDKSDKKKGKKKKLSK